MDSWTFNPDKISVSQGNIQQWVAPYAGRFRITAYGAQGGGAFGGRGAVMSGVFEFSEGETIDILVGHQGEAINNDCAGGGGTFVATPTGSPLLVAGGGGGGFEGESDLRHATINQDANPGGAAGGTEGNGGYTSNQTIDGGAGFFTNGESLNPSPAPQAYLNGGEGGHNVNPYSSQEALGGFGGGGGASRGSSNLARGGGGGFSGGGAGYNSQNAGGGGSFNLGTDQENIDGASITANTGDGLVVIEALGAPPSDGSTSKVSGVVQIKGTPAQRTVRAFSYRAIAHQIDGEAVTASKSLGQSISDPSTGEYTIDLLAGYSEAVFVIAFDDYGMDFQADMAVTVGDRVHPSISNGHVWECTGSGTLPSEEPAWVIDTETAQLYGTASMIARPFYRPVVHGPVNPEVIAPDPAP
jgi:hypothetical protein